METNPILQRVLSNRLVGKANEAERQWRPEHRYMGCRYIARRRESERSRKAMETLLNVFVIL